MGDLEELVELINAMGRRVYVTEDAIDLRDPGRKNMVYILQVPDRSTAAGGRGGGFGERRIIKLSCYEFGDGGCRKVKEVEEESVLDSLDLPYHATAMPIILPDGREKVVSGVVDPSFAASYKAVLG